MYVKHFGLTYKPFNAAPDPRFLWLGEDQKKQIASLRHALLTQSGFVLITGDVGTGKTVLAKWLAESITKAAIVVRIPDPDMEKLDFFNFIADGLGLEQYFESKADFLIGLKRRLGHADDHSRKIVLVIDEAHRLRQEMLQEIRLLANIDSGGRMQLSTVLAGLPGIEDMLRDDRNRNVLQRVSASIHLAPLTAESTRT